MPNEDADKHAPMTASSLFGVGVRLLGIWEILNGLDDLIAYGPLLSDDGAAWLGTAALLQAPDAGAARGLLPVERYAAIEVHHWDFGGRPS